MFNLIRADLYKLGKSKAIKILFLISCFAAGAMTVISYFMTQKTVSGDLVGIGSLFTDFQMMTLLGSIIASSYICGDFENKTIQDAISCGTSRGTVILSKAIVYFIAVALMILPYSIFTGFAFVSGYEFTPFLPSVFLLTMANESGVTFSIPVLFKFLILMFTTVVIYGGQLSICVLMAFAFRKSVPVIGITYAISFSSVRLMSIPVCKTVLSYTPFGVEFTDLTLNAEMGAYIKAIAISIIFISFILAITYLLFRKSEVK